MDSTISVAIWVIGATLYLYQISFYFVFYVRNFLVQYWEVFQYICIVYTINWVWEWIIPNSSTSIERNSQPTAFQKLSDPIKMWEKKLWISYAQNVFSSNTPFHLDRTWFSKLNICSIYASKWISQLHRLNGDEKENM